MSGKYIVSKGKRIGNPDSKYGYQPWKLDEDIQKTIEKSKLVKDALMKWIQEHRLVPSQVRRYFVAVLEEIGEIEKSYEE